MPHFDVVVLGAGPGGYVAAIRAAQLGRSVAVVESKYWGGVCLNVGCIPSKALLRNAELAHLVRDEGKTFGISGEVSFDYGAAFDRSRTVADGRVKGVHFLMKKNKITEFDGWGSFTDPHTLQVALNTGGADGEPAQVHLPAGAVLVARLTGGQPEVAQDQARSAVLLGQRHLHAGTSRGDAEQVGPAPGEHHPPRGVDLDERARGRHVVAHADAVHPARRRIEVDGDAHPLAVALGVGEVPEDDLRPGRDVQRDLERIPCGHGRSPSRCSASARSLSRARPVRQRCSTTARSGPSAS